MDRRELSSDRCDQLCPRTIPYLGPDGKKDTSWQRVDVLCARSSPLFLFASSFHPCLLATPFRRIRMPHQLPRSVVVLGGAALAALLSLSSFSLSSCQTEKAAAPKTCCDQPKTPPGVPAFTVINDEVSGPQRRAEREDPRRAEAEDQARRHLPGAAVPLSLRDDPQIVRAGHLRRRVLHQRGRGAGRRQPGGQDLARARRQGPEVREHHPARVPRAGAEGVRLQLEPRASPRISNDTCHLNEKKKIRASTTSSRTSRP